MRVKTKYQLGRFAGISVFVHWSLLVALCGLFIWLLWRGLSWQMALDSLALVAALFVCVILHEFGHALTARRFGIPTLNITMYPIGGIALLASMPRVPRQEFLIAIAGPAVNFAIFVALTVVALVGDGLSTLGNLVRSGGTGLAMISALAWMNLLLVVFNLVPAFPMDGGRVLRAALAMRFNYRRATRIAGLIGQVLAILFALAAVFPNPIFNGFNPLLLFVAIFVFTAARQETAQVLRATESVP